MPKKTYIIAVSGGIDSVTLLDMLAHKRLPTEHDLYNADLIVAHFDHGIRPDSTEVGRGVGELAAHYHLPFELGSAKLGSGASEEKARETRYNFLRQSCIKYSAAGIITAHHQDDLIETALLNLLRGTNWRGLASMFESNFHGFPIIRPLLTVPKTTLQAYAREQGLPWHEDPTNVDQKYLRNYIRHTLIPKLESREPEFRQKILKHINNTHALKKDIATMLQNELTTHSSLAASSIILPRHRLIMLPSSVSLELIYITLLQLDPAWHPSAYQLRRVLHFVKVGQPGKVLEVSGTLKVVLKTKQVQFSKQR